MLLLYVIFIKINKTRRRKCDSFKRKKDDDLNPYLEKDSFVQKFQ